MSKKILLFVISLICIFSISLTAYAEEYGTEYPSYVNYSGGAYVEVQSTLGRGSLIFQNTYKSGYFGFSGSGYSLCNISNSTLTGRYITSTGKVYNVRFGSFSTPQYYYENGMSREWLDLSITKIYNTNVEFSDNTSLNRDNIIDVFDNNSFQYTVVGLLILLFISNFVIVIRSVRV